jgi:hypothetical protein
MFDVLRILVSKTVENGAWGRDQKEINLSDLCG